MNNVHPQSLYKTHADIFRAGSKTYFYSSMFFPRPIRHEVYALYSFVRVADDLVDAVPQQKDEFYRFTAAYRDAERGSPSGDQVIDPFVALSKRAGFSPDWTEAFLRSMEWDITRSSYATVDELLEYIYGSAEVVGLYMSRILALPAKATEAAICQGRAMQLINFIRDIDEDNQLGRRYLPAEETSLTDLTPESAYSDPAEFTRYIRFQIERYADWQEQASRGFHMIPYRYRIPVAAAADMYAWTARRIYADPFLVFTKKLKPSKYRVAAAALRRAFGIAPIAKLPQREPNND